MDARGKQQVQLRLDLETWANLKTLAHEERLSMTSYIIHLILREWRLYQAERGKNWPQDS